MIGRGEGGGADAYYYSFFLWNRKGREKETLFKMKPSRNGGNGQRGTIIILMLFGQGSIAHYQ